MNTKSYAWWVILLPLTLLTLIAVINRTIDPYQIFSVDRLGLFSAKPALHSNMRLHKAYQVKLQKPDTLILGSSKAIQGIPTSHAYFEDGLVYNLAMPLASMKEIAYLLEHANETQQIKKVAIGLDFLSFNALARQDGPASGFVPGRLFGKDYSIATSTQDCLSALISLDAIKASIKAWQARQSAQKSATASPIDYSQLPSYTHRVLTGQGGRLDDEIRSRLKDGGHRSNTIKIEEFFTSAVYLPSPFKQFSFRSNDQDSLYWFEQFLRTLYENKIEVGMFISPSHARLNELIDAAGLWPQFEQWKRRIVALNTLVAKEYGQTAYTLWDFSSPGDITTEPFPSIGDSGHQMQYYYEAIHFNQHTGKLVLDRLGPQEHVYSVHTEDFGLELNQETIEKVLESIRLKQTAFSRQFPEYRAELDSIMARR